MKFISRKNSFYVKQILQKPIVKILRLSGVGQQRLYVESTTWRWKEQKGQRIFVTYRKEQTLQTNFDHRWRDQIWSHFLDDFAQNLARKMGLFRRLFWGT